MIPFNHENVMMIATAICVIGVIFLLRELNKTKEELYELKEFSEDVMEKLNGIDGGDDDDDESLSEITPEEGKTVGINMSI
jgi:hypothetical protein|tara:strand:- start:4309 stop:4551 length:243 start_codon:yes stop_codon:yes gene_type:complete